MRRPAPRVKVGRSLGRSKPARRPRHAALGTVDPRRPKCRTTNFTYDTTARTTTVAAPLTRTTTFHWDATGLVRRIVNPLGQSTYQTWTGDRQLASVTDPTTGPAADAPTQTFTYNANGMLTSATNQADERTELTYQNTPADAADPGQHLSLLTRRVNPKGTATATAGDFTFDFAYDPAGNLTKVTFPPNPDGTRDAATNTYNPDGTLASTTDPRGNTTTFPAYDRRGSPP